jgi:hypothetical protein
MVKATEGVPPLITAVATRAELQVTLAVPFPEKETLRFLLAEVTVKAVPEGTVATMLPVFTTTESAPEPALIIRLMSGFERSAVTSAG